MVKVSVMLFGMIAGIGVLQASTQTLLRIYVPTTLFIENGQKLGLSSASDIIDELHDSLAKTKKKQDRNFLNTRLAIIYFINGIILECLTNQVLELVPEAKNPVVREELTQVPIKVPVYISPAFKRLKIASPKIIENLRSAVIPLEKLKELVYTLITCADFANFFELSGKAQPALSLNKDFNVTKLNQYLQFVEPALGIILALEKTPAQKRADLEAIKKELKKAGVIPTQYERFAKLIDEQIPPIINPEDVYALSRELRSLGT